MATAAVISWRFASSSIGRFASAFFDHRRRKWVLLLGAAAQTYSQLLREAFGRCAAHLFAA